MSTTVTVYRIGGAACAEILEDATPMARSLPTGDHARFLPLDKAFQAVHAVLGGFGADPSRGGAPLGFLGDERIGEEISFDWSCGPGRLISPSITRAIDEALRTVSDADVTARLDAEVMSAEVYPFTLSGFEDEDRSWIEGSVRGLRSFVAQAVREGCGLLVAVT